VDGTQNLNTEVKETYGKIILLTQELDGVKKEIKDKHEWTVKSLYKTAKLIKNK
jgi:hypothetical protein